MRDDENQPFDTSNLRRCGRPCPWKVCPWVRVQVLPFTNTRPSMHTNTYTMVPLFLHRSSCPWGKYLTLIHVWKYLHSVCAFHQHTYTAGCIFHAMNIARCVFPRSEIMNAACTGTALTHIHETNERNVIIKRKLLVSTWPSDTATRQKYSASWWYILETIPKRIRLNLFVLHKLFFSPKSKICTMTDLKLKMIIKRFVQRRLTYTTKPIHRHWLSIGAAQAHDSHSSIIRSIAKVNVEWATNRFAWEIVLSWRILFPIFMCTI